MEALVIDNPDFQAVEQSRGVFCPFEAIGMIHQEIRHAHFLQYCLDPQRPHGFGTECLRAIMRAAANVQRAFSNDQDANFLTPLGVHVMDFEAVEVRREWRRIDLLIVIRDERRREKLVVAIELKIDASEHSEQLGRYRTTVAQQWPASEGWRHLLLFLTRVGDDTSDDGAGWLPLSLEALAGEFDNVVRKQLGSPEARAMLVAYLAMLRRHFLTEQNLVDMAGRLWGQHREALDLLMEHRPDTGDGIAGRLIERQKEIEQRLTQASGLTIMIDSTSPRQIRFAVAEWDDLPDFRTANGWTSSRRLILLEVWRRNSGGNGGVRFVLGPGPAEVRLRYFEALKAAGVPLSAKKEITNRFTRLASQSVPDGIDELADSSDQIDQAVDHIVDKVVAYAAERIPAFDRALGSLRV